MFNPADKLDMATFGRVRIDEAKTSPACPAIYTDSIDDEREQTERAHTRYWAFAPTSH